MIVLIILIYFALVYAAFRFIKIPIRPLSISIAILLGIVIISVIVASWQGGAPVSQQITLTRYVVSINPNVKGLIKKVNVTVGDRVKKGHVLFEIDPAPFQAAVDQSAAQLAAAKAEVDRLEAAVELASATVARSRADAASVKADKDAADKLLASGSAAVRELRVFKLRRAYEAAEAAVKESLASEEQSKFALVAGKANVNSIQGQLDSAEFNLSQTLYKAPADGLVTNWQARVGTITTALRASAIGTFMETSNARIIAVLPQNLMRNVKVGDPVELAFMSRPGKIDAGKVIRVNKYTGEGQIAPSGDLPVVANIGSKGFLAATIKLDDEALGPELSLGEAGAAAIYTQPAGPFHVVSKIYLRMLSILSFLP